MIAVILPAIGAAGAWLVFTIQDAVRSFWTWLTRDRVAELMALHDAEEAEAKLRRKVDREFATRNTPPLGEDIGEWFAQAEHKVMAALNMPEGRTWPGDCTNCVWWVPSPSEAEDFEAVYRPCPLHDVALWAEMEKKSRVMNKPSRRYQLLPDRAVCLAYGCPWHLDGPVAEPMAAVHHTRTGHETQVTTGATVTFATRQEARVGS